MIYANASKVIDRFIDVGNADEDLHTAVVLQSMALREIIALHLEIISERSMEKMLEKSSDLDQLVFEYYDIAFGESYGRDAIV